MNRGANAGLRRVSSFFLSLFLAAAPLLAAHFSLQQTHIPIRQIDLSPALKRGPFYPAIDWEKLDFNNPAIVTSNHVAQILKNDRVEVILLPAMGKIYAIIDRQTRRNQLWTNPIARPIRAHNDTGWWMVWGGIEFTVPRGEHGTTWSLPWTHSIAENSLQRKAVRMEVNEPATGLRQELTVAIRPHSALVETEIRLTNTSHTNVPFAHWTNPMLAPGGRNQVTPHTFPPPP